MQTHRNPTRRNRNIGTAKQGHGQDNALVIPDRSGGVHWLDRIGDHDLEDRVIANRPVRFVTEKNRLDCVHPCTVADVVHVLESLPQSDWTGLNTFVLRQPTRKQLILSPVWGRLLYHAEISTVKGNPIAKGPTIFLDAIVPDKTMTWSTSLDPDDTQELQRLKSDGHEVRKEGRKYQIKVSATAARATQLYRTLLHEIGHWFDWLTKVEEPLSRGEEWENLERSYFSRPKSEREAFAHSYADTQRALLEAKGLIPFPQD